MRAKWSAPIRKYWKISEQMMVKYCDLAICDSVNIEKYIHDCYDGKGIKGRNPKTTFIAYGADNRVVYSLMDKNKPTAGRTKAIHRRLELSFNLYLLLPFVGQNRAFQKASYI